MGLQINHNIMALDAYRNLSVTQGELSKSLEKLSSGLRINKAADDAAGLVISEKLRSQANGLGVAVRNAQDGISVVQTAEGALTETTAILQRMRDLTVQAQNSGANDTTAVAAAQSEFDQLTSELDRIAKTTKFGTKNLLDGSYSNEVFQVGANTGETLGVTIDAMDSSALGVTGLSVSGSTTLNDIDTALSTVTSQRGDLGAIQNRLEHTINNLSVAQENLTASESRIRDTDMAKEMTNFTRAQILQQAGTAMLAQANSLPQSVLKLLG